MKLKKLVGLSIGLSALIYGQSLFAIQNTVNLDHKPLFTPSEQTVKFFRTQVERGSSVPSALNSLLNRYPQKTADFVAVALSAYPEKYKEIISTSVSAQPMFVDEIIMVALEYKVASSVEIVEIAVSAEPSYAGMATSAACKYNPEQFIEIVKSAVTAEPDSADQIAQKLVTAYPSKTMEILITTIKEVPYVGKYVLDALLATVSDDPSKSEDMIIITVEQLAQYPDAMDRLVQLAQQRNIASEKIKESALKGGLSEDAVAAVLSEHYKN